MTAARQLDRPLLLLTDRGFHSTRQPETFRFMPKTCDAIIIGAGMGGLTAALLLARRGLKVTVLEAHDRPGGAASSWVRKARDRSRIVRRFVFDAGVQDISGLGPGGPLSVLLEGAEESGLQWRRVRHRYIQDGLSIDVPETRQDFAALLCARFPEERPGIKRLFAEIERLEREIERNTGRLLHGDTVIGDISAWASANPAMMRWMREPYEAFLDNFIRDPALRGLLTVISEYVTENPKLLTVGNMAPLFAYYRHGGFYPIGGTQKLSDALMREIRRLGGSVRLKTAVSRITRENGRVIGVETAGGDKIAARQVIANIDAAICYRDLIGNPVLPENYSRRLRTRACGPSGILVSLGLDTVPDLPARTFLHEAGLCLGISNPSVIDASLAPPGHAAVTLLRLIGDSEAAAWQKLSGEAYEREKARIADDVIAMAEKAIPGLHRHIVHHETATPRTFRRYIRSPNGGIYGAAIGQWTPGADTPVPGLIFAGAGTRYGPGVEAAILSGFEAANHALATD